MERFTAALERVFHTSNEIFPWEIHAHKEDTAKFTVENTMPMVFGVSYDWSQKLKANGEFVRFRPWVQAIAAIMNNAERLSIMSTQDSNWDQGFFLRLKNSLVPQFLHESRAAIVLFRSVHVKSKKVTHTLLVISLIPSAHGTRAMTHT